MSMKTLIILKMSFLILSTILDLILVLVSVNYFSNLRRQYKQVIYYIPKDRSFLRHKKLFYSIKLKQFFSLTFYSFGQFTGPFTLSVLKNAKVQKFLFANLKMFCVLIFIDINQVFNNLQKAI